MNMALLQNKSISEFTHMELWERENHECQTEALREIVSLITRAVFISVGGGQQ